MMMLTVIALILISAAICFVFYNYFSGVMRNELRDWADVFRRVDVATVLSEVEGVDPNNTRVTLIGSDGVVRYDNAVDANAMENHADREEIAEAFKSGAGESRRLSGTLGEETYYYAVRLADGTVLRASKTRNSVWGMFSESLPAVALVVLVVFIVGYFMARNLTRRIVAPINNVDLKEETVTPPYDELAPFIRTIEHQREQIATQFEDLKKRSDTINAIMDNMKEGIIFVDERGVIASINSSAGAILSTGGSVGYGALREAEGKSVLEVVRDIDLMASVREALAGNRGEVMKEYDGRTYRVFISPVTGGGAIILLLDVTEKAMAEKLRREFSANVSHELKTPLTSIYGYAEMLYNGMIGKNDEHKLLGKIKDEAQRMNTLVQDIITVSKLDEGEGGDAFEDVDLRAVATEAVEALSLNTRENRIAVSVSVGDIDDASGDLDSSDGSGAATAIRTRADRSMMYEMFYNLIDNAVKYNKPGGEVKIDIRKADIADRVESTHAPVMRALSGGLPERFDPAGVPDASAQPGSWIKITVADTGIGIPKESQDRVFERFYRVDKSRSKKKGGTGLGLAIVKHIVLLHEGRVSLESRENEGTTITVFLPEPD
jgi:two-component system phosphate regulon sensor histidine kinase PhoR